MQILDHFFDSGDELIETTSGSSNVKVHAVRQSDGTVAVMIINLLSGAGSNADVSIDIEGALLGDTGIQWAYGSTGGSAPVQSSVSGLGNSFDYNIAPRTLIVLLIPPDELPGDYNDDGSVDAADYVLWRNTLDQTVGLRLRGRWRRKRHHPAGRLRNLAGQLWYGRGGIVGRYVDSHSRTCGRCIRPHGVARLHDTPSNAGWLKIGSNLEKAVGSPFGSVIAGAGNQLGAIDGSIECRLDRRGQGGGVANRHERAIPAVLQNLSRPVRAIGRDDRRAAT